VDNPPGDTQNAQTEILTQLRLHIGNDLTNYKRATLIRRIKHRIIVTNLPDLVSYAAFVQQHAEETNAMLKDLLISVINFFCEKTFEAIQTDILPGIIQQKDRRSRFVFG
jgi:two-component system, chemotaxis family, CheB/CheR fusion protein